MIFVNELFVCLSFDSAQQNVSYPAHVAHVLERPDHTRIDEKRTICHIIHFCLYHINLDITQSDARY